MGNHSDNVMLEHQVCLQHDWEKQKEAEDLLCASSTCVCVCVCVSLPLSLWSRKQTWLGLGFEARRVRNSMWDLVCRLVFLGRKMAGATGAMESGSGSGAAATGDGVFDVAHIGEVKTWLRGAFEAVGKEVPEFEYTPSTVAHLHSLATLSQHRTHAANVIATDLRQQAAEYRSQGQR
jgi:hypothetical protein